MSSKLIMPLRYGENPHQKAALYASAGPAARGIAQAEQVQGKELSYNNLNDANAALELVAEFADGPPTVVIVKHANPCGVASGETLAEAWAAALACDSVSAFGGIVAVNRPLDGATAEAITEIFTEVVVAPDADDDARAIFAGKKNVRLLLTGALARSRARRADVDGHRRRRAGPGPRQWPCSTDDMLKVVTRRAPTEQRTGRLPVRLDRRQARQVERHRLRQGRRHRRHRRRADEPPRFGAHRRGQGDRSGRDDGLGANRARSARRSPATPSSPSPTACSPRSRPAPPRSSSRADRCATPKSSPPPTRPAWRCCSPACATSGTEALPQPRPFGSGVIAARRRSVLGSGSSQLGDVGLASSGTVRGPRGRSRASTAPPERGEDRRNAEHQLGPFGQPDHHRADHRRRQRRPDQRPAPARHRARRGSARAAAT